MRLGIGFGIPFRASSVFEPLQGPPGEIDDLVATAGDEQVTLTWSEPDDGNAPPLLYFIDRRTSPVAPWVEIDSSLTAGYVDTGLTNGTTYIYRVRVWNDLGSSYETESNQASASPAPDVGPAPVLSAATDEAATYESATFGVDTDKAGGTLYLVVTSSATTPSAAQIKGGLDHTGAAATVAGTRSVLSAGTVSGTVAGLPESSTLYTHFVHNGPEGQDSNTISADGFTTPAAPATQVPSAPLNVTGAPGDGLVALQWTAPVDNGGAAVTDYIIEWSADGSTGWATIADGTSANTFYTDTGLTNGSARYYRVSAVNSAGTGAASTVAGPFTPSAASSVTFAQPDGGADIVVAYPITSNTPVMAMRPYEDANDGTTFVMVPGVYLSTAAVDLNSGFYRDGVLIAGTEDTWAYTLQSPADDGALIEYRENPSTVNGALGTNPQIVQIQEASATTAVFLLGGQSNMIGRGLWDSGAAHPAGTMQYLQNETLSAATIPLDHNGEIAGDMGLDVQFAIDYKAANPTHDIVFIPCAKGGTGFINGEWTHDGVGNLYADMVFRANQYFTENPGAKLIAILWHQGENDASNSNASYQADLDAMLNAVRSDVTVATATTPIILGNLVPDFVAADPFHGTVNDIISDTPNRIAYTAVASNTGLDDRGDDLHFDGASLRTLGSRYFTELANAAANVPAIPDAFVSGDWSVVGGDTVADVTVSALPTQNGSAITDVEYRIDGGAAVSSGGTSDFQITGLTNDVAVNIELRAVNAIGAGPWGDTKSVTPSAGASTDFAAAVAAAQAVDAGAILFNVTDAVTRGIIYQDTGGLTPASADGHTVQRIDAEGANFTGTATLRWDAGASKWYLESNGSTDRMDAAFVHTGTDTYTAWIGNSSSGNNVRLASVGVDGSLDGGQNGFGIRNRTAPEWQIQRQDNAVASVFTDTNTHTGTFEAQLSSTQVETFVNGVSEDISTATFLAMNTQIVRLFDGTDSGRASASNLYAFALLRGTPNTTQRAAIRLGLEEN